jgi:hypothetical protein
MGAHAVGRDAAGGVRGVGDGVDALGYASMGVCTLCGQDAGWFSDAHRECQDRRDAGWKLMLVTARDAYLRPADPSDTKAVQEKLSSLERSSYQQDGALRRALLQGFEEALDSVLDDRVLSEDEERRLMEATDNFGVTKEELQGAKGWLRLVKAAVLRDVLAGTTVKSRVKADFAVPFNLQRSETLIWLFQDARYGEYRTRTQYVGGSQGVSVRVMRGVYYRVGAFRSEPIQTTHATVVDTGLLGITNKHLYFAGSVKGLRIPYRKIASFTPYSDGIGVHRDAVTARQQFFQTEDGWFTYNLVTNLARLAAE